MKKFAAFISNKKIELKYTNLHLETICKISNGEISKIIDLQRQNVKARVFYFIYRGLGIPFEEITNYVFQDVNLKLHKPKIKSQTNLGKILLEIDSQASLKEFISEKTGISITRLNALYYGTGSPNADELLLIEMAINKEPGELFEKLYEEEFRIRIVKAKDVDDNNGFKTNYSTN